MRHLHLIIATALIAVGLHNTPLQAQCDFPTYLNLRVLLEGPLDSATGLMSDTLRTQGLLPLTEPYTALGYQYRGGGGGETMDPAMLLTEGPDAIVDWVVVEVRYPNDPGRMLLSRSALLQRDGDIISLDGNPVGLCVETGQHHIAVRHRNHLGIMTGRPVEFYSGQFGIIFADPVDLSSPLTATYRNNDARRRMGTHMALWSGDVSFDGKVQYTGIGNDRDLVLQAIGGVTPTNTTSGYGSTDLNLDGSTRYTGQNNDRDQILRTVGGVVPTKIREGYVPKDSLTLRPNVHVVDPLLWVLDTTYSDLDSGNVLVFTVNSNNEAIDTGHIVVGGEYGGYLRRVIGVDSSGTVLTITTEQASFYDVFASGIVSFTTEVGSPASAQFSAFAVDPGSGGGGSNFQFPNGLCVSGGLSNTSASVTGSLRQTGDVSPAREEDAFSWEFAGQIALHGKLSIQVASCASPIEVKLPLVVPIPFAAGVPVPVGPGLVVVIPVSGTIELNLVMKLEVQVGQSFTFSNDFNLDAAGRIGVSMERGLPSPILAMDVFQPSFGPESQSFPTATVQCKFSSVIESHVKLYNMLGPYLQYGANHNIKYTFDQVSEDSDLEYKNTFKAKAGLKGDVWGKTDFLSLELESPTIAEYKWPGMVERISDRLQLGQEEEELADPLEVKVSSVLKILGMEVGSFPAEGVQVHFSTLSGGGTIVEENLGPVMTDANGSAKAHWILGTLDAGEQIVQAHVRKGSGSNITHSPIAFDAEIETFVMEILSGDEQIGSVNNELMNPLVVRVTNQLGEPIEALPVHFELASGTGSVSDDFVSTSSEGLAGTMFTLGFDAAARNEVRAYALTLTGDTIEGAPVHFKAYIDPDTMFYAQLSGNLQTGSANTVLPVDLRVQVNSVQGQEPQEDVLVFFEVTSGGGSVSSFGTSTNSEGIASVAWTLGPDLSIRQKVKAWAIDVYGDTLRGGPLEFEACTIICPPTAMDLDGNVYNVVKIGCDCWFKSNLRTTHYANGDSIPQFSTSTVYIADYEDNEINDNQAFYSGMIEYQGPLPHDGPVYNSSTVQDSRGVCPAGWHVSSTSDWSRMALWVGVPPNEITLGSYGWDPITSTGPTVDFMGALKLPSAWPGDTTATDLTGLSLTPGPVINYVGGVCGSSQLGYEFVEGVPDGYRLRFDTWDQACGIYSNLNPYTGIWMGPYLGAWIQPSSGLVAYFSPGGTRTSYCRCVMD